MKSVPFAFQKTNLHHFVPAKLINCQYYEINKYQNVVFWRVAAFHISLKDQVRTNGLPYIKNLMEGEKGCQMHVREFDQQAVICGLIVNGF